MNNGSQEKLVDEDAICTNFSLFRKGKKKKTYESRKKGEKIPLLYTTAVEFTFYLLQFLSSLLILFFFIFSFT